MKEFALAGAAVAMLAIPAAARQAPAPAGAQPITRALMQDRIEARSYAPTPITMASSTPPKPGPVRQRALRAASARRSAASAAPVPSPGSTPTATA